MHLLQLICLLAALMTNLAHAEPPNFTVAGLEMGKAKWQDLARIDTKRNTLQRETSGFPTDDLGVAHITGPLTGKFAGDATLYFDSNQVLAGAVLSVPKGQVPKYLGQLAKQARAKESGHNQFSRGEWVMRLVASKDGSEALQIATPAFAEKIANRTTLIEVREAQQTALFRYGAWAVAAAVAIGLAFVAGPSLLKRRRALYEHTLVGVAVLGTLLALYSRGERPTTLAGYALALLTTPSLWIAVRGAQRTVMASGWLPVKNAYLGAAAATLAAPVLFVPLVLRNMVKSLPYATSLLLMLAIALLGYAYWQPGLVEALRALPLLALLSGGVVRTASVSFSWAQKRVPARFALLGVALALLISPLTMLLGLVLGALTTLRMVFSPVGVVLVLCLIGVSTFDGHWLPSAAAALVGLFMLSPLLAPAIMPTGVSGLDFSSLDTVGATSFPTTALDFGGPSAGFSDAALFGGFNPANGMPLLDGTGGMDVFGNSFGSNANDPF